jgi:translation initiation factor 4E
MPIYTSSRMEYVRYGKTPRMQRFFVCLNKVVLTNTQQHDASSQGGKWVLTFRTPDESLLDRCWTWLALALIGEVVDENNEIVGAGSFFRSTLSKNYCLLREYITVASTRPRANRIQVWVRDKDQVERVNSIGQKLLDLLELNNEPSVSLDFAYHEGPSPVIYMAQF